MGNEIGKVISSPAVSATPPLSPPVVPVTIPPWLKVARGDLNQRSRLDRQELHLEFPLTTLLKLLRAHLILDTTYTDSALAL